MQINIWVQRVLMWIFILIRKTTFVVGWCTSESEEKEHTCCEIHIFTSALQFAIGASNFIQMSPQDPNALYIILIGRALSPCSSCKIYSALGPEVGWWKYWVEEKSRK